MPHRRLPVVFRVASSPLQAPRRFRNPENRPGLGPSRLRSQFSFDPFSRSTMLRSRPPLRRPRPLRFERLRVPVWNPYSRDRLGPAKSEDRKGGEGKADANLTIFLAPAAPGTPTRRHALGRLPTPPPLPENLLLRLHRKLPSAPPA